MAPCDFEWLSRQPKKCVHGELAFFAAEALIKWPSAERFKGPTTGKILPLKVAIKPDNHLSDEKKKNYLHEINNDGCITCIKY